MSKSFKNHEDARFMIGNEVPNNDVGLMYHEVPQLTPEKSLNALYNINLLPDLEENSLGFTKSLYTNTEGILYDDTCSPYIVNSKDFTITDVTKGNDDEPVYYNYQLRYLHRSEKSNPINDITIYLNDNKYEKNDYYIEYSEIEDNLYQVNIYTDYRDNEFDMYSIEYHPDSINIDNYKEIINFEPIYKRVYNNNPSDKEYYLTENEGTNYIITDYPASTTEKSYHDSTKAGYADTTFDYQNIIKGYKASEGKGIYIYFLVDGSHSMKASNGLVSDYRGYDVANRLTSNILSNIYNNTPSYWNIKTHLQYFNTSSWNNHSDGSFYEPSKNNWYSRGTVNNLYDLGYNTDNLKGNDPDYKKFLGRAVEELINTKQERKGHKTIFVFMSDGRAEKTSNSRLRKFAEKLLESGVDYIWSFAIGPEGDWNTLYGYDNEDIDRMEAFASINNASVRVVDRDDSAAISESEAADDFINAAPTLPQIYTQVFEEGTKTVGGAFCNSEWEQFLETSKILPGSSFHPKNLTLINNITGPACLNKDYYFGYEDIPEELDLTDEYIEYEEV